MSTNPSPSAAKAIGNGFAALTKPPFRTLVLLSLLIALTSTTFSDTPNEVETASSIVLLIASVYIQIALILAAGRDEPEPSPDAWLRGAALRRCFWRFVGTSLVVVLGLLAGALILVVGMFFVGALVGLAQSACVVERRLPMDAITRSARLANQAKGPVGIVFGVMVLMPTVVTQSAAALGWSGDIGPLWPAAVAAGELISAAGAIALTRMFVALGGDKTPAPDQLKPAPRRVVS